LLLDPLVLDLLFQEGYLLPDTAVKTAHVQ
jgi:hypothetical protein